MTAATKRSLLYLCLFAVLFAVTFTITYNCPLIADDYEFADLHYTSLGDVLRYSLYYGNGRLLGNVGAVYFINFPVVNAAIKAAVLLGVILLIPIVLGCGNGKPQNLVYLFLLTFAAVLGMNPIIFVQVITWTSGFYNYFPPILCLLICITVICSCKDRKWQQVVVLLAAGIAGQLYVEHSTIVNVIMAIWYCVFYRYIDRDKNKESCARIWLLASIIGALFMVLIPKFFHGSGNRVEIYRTYQLGGVTGLIGQALTCTADLITTFSGCTVLWILFSLFGLLTVKGSPFYWKHTFLRKLSVCLYVVLPVISVVFKLTETMDLPAVKLFRYVLVYCGLFLYLVMLLISFLTIENRQIKLQLISFVAFAALSVAPFVVVSHFQTRCMLLVYTFTVMIAIKGLDYQISKQEISIAPKHLAALSAAIVCLIVYLEVDFSKTRDLTQQRTAYIESCMESGERRICIYVMPSQYASYDGGMAEYYFYYQERGDIEFETVAYDVWVARGYGQLPE